MIDPILITPPAPLVTPEEVITHLHLDCEEDYAVLETHIDAATRWMDGWNGILGRCILTQTWETRMPSLRSTRLPFPDVQSATVSYLDPAGEEVEVDPAQFRLRTRHGRGELVFDAGFVAPPVLPNRDDAVTIRATYGWTAAPPGLKVAAMVLVGHWLSNREGAAESIPASVSALVAPYRVGLV